MRKGTKNLGRVDPLGKKIRVSPMESLTIDKMKKDAKRLEKQRKKSS